jgi:glycosyltransferase involved in cell wall biosynthesis
MKSAASPPVLGSGVAAARRWDSEVVLADSDSTDHTVEIARGYPMRIVQLANPDEKSRGGGAQLAFQSARGDYFWLLDADMMLNPDFAGAAIAWPDSHPDASGVNGRLQEINTQSESFEILAAAAHSDPRTGSSQVDPVADEAHFLPVLGEAKGPRFLSTSLISCLPERNRERSC